MLLDVLGCTRTTLTSAPSVTQSTLDFLGASWDAAWASLGRNVWVILWKACRDGDR